MMTSNEDEVAVTITPNAGDIESAEPLNNGGVSECISNAIRDSDELLGDIKLEEAKTNGAVAKGEEPKNKIRFAENPETREFKRLESGIKGQAAAVVWKDLTVSLKGINKVLLNNVSCEADGGFWAAMGPSGSGKSTLLNALAFRTDPNLIVTGERRLNGRPYTSTQVKAMAGYVLQDDLLNAHLTVEETLGYVALLRLPSSLTNEERAQRVQEAVEQVGISHCRQTIVGNALRKGISGGERKRLCVAMELITRPQLLLLDEPTSGLDSVTALSVCRRLKTIAESGACTVICTIHQPQAKIFHLFDNLIILKAGNIVYQGDTAGSLNYYAANGFPCPTSSNPADHLLDVITTPLSMSGTMNTVRGDSLLDLDGKLIQNFVQPKVDLNLGSERPWTTRIDPVPYYKQYFILTKRSLMEQKRKTNIILTHVIQNAVIALLIGFVFFHFGYSQSGIKPRQAVLFFCVINQGVFGAMYVINVFPSERMLFLRERAAGMYNVSSYFLAKNTGELIPQLLTPIVFTCVVYFILDWQNDASKFFLFMFFMILCSLSSTSLAMAVSALCRSADLSVTVLPMALEVARLFGGFFLPPAQLPKYFAWIDVFSYVKYTYVGVSLNELHGLTYACAENERCAEPGIRTTGTETIKALGLDYISIGGCIGALLLYIFVCRFVAYVGLRVFKH